MGFGRVKPGFENDFFLESDRFWGLGRFRDSSQNRPDRIQPGSSSVERRKRRKSVQTLVDPGLGHLSQFQPASRFRPNSDLTGKRDQTLVDDNFGGPSQFQPASGISPIAVLTENVTKPWSMSILGTRTSSSQHPEIANWRNSLKSGLGGQNPVQEVENGSGRVELALAETGNSRIRSRPVRPVRNGFGRVKIEVLGLKTCPGLSTSPLAHGSGLGTLGQVAQRSGSTDLGRFSDFGTFPF